MASVIINNPHKNKYSATITATGNQTANLVLERYGNIVSFSLSGLTDSTLNHDIIFNDAVPADFRPSNNVVILGSATGGSLNVSTQGILFQVTTAGRISSYTYKAFSSATANGIYFAS